MADIRREEKKTEEEEFESDDANVGSTTDETNENRRDRRPVEAPAGETGNETETGQTEEEQGGV